MCQFADGQFTPGARARVLRSDAKILPDSFDERGQTSLRHHLASSFVLTLTAIFLAGCGGSSSGGSGSQPQPNPTPSITSVSPTSVTAGGSGFTLTVNGSNFISSSVIQWNSSALTTSYTSATQLTAAVPTANIAKGQTASITVVNPAPGGGSSLAVSVVVNNPTPTITSVSPASLLTDSASQVVTVNGTGFVPSSTVTIGGVSHSTTFVNSSQVTSNTTANDVAGAGSESVTVNNPTPGGGTSNSANITIADILINSTSLGPQLSSQQVGTNLQATFGDVTQSQFVAEFKSMGIGLIRWPGGELSDWYLGQSNTFSSCSPYGPNPSNGFDNFMQAAAGVSSNVAITVNYGTNSTCTAGGDPAVAAAWVKYANVTKNYGIKYWTVGNEEYYPTDPDSNTPAHDPTTYANRVATLFYPQMKAVDPSILVGVDVLGGQGCTVATGNTCGWDAIVLAKAKYDFVEVHVYPENGANDSDSYLLTEGPSLIATTVATVQSELAAAGNPGVPIYLGEFDGSSNFADKQQISITDALFDGMAVGEVAKAGLVGATTWDGIDLCGNGGNFSANLYGWQTFSTMGLLPEVDGTSTGSTTANLCSTFGVIGLTPFPRARAFTLASQFIHQGEHVLALQAALSTSSLRAYAATQGTGYALMLFNLDENETVQQTIQIQGSTAAQFSGTASTYGKAQYDESQNNVWAGPVTTPLGTLENPFKIELPPWSMTVVHLTP